jgi:hypothetical protein
MDITAIGQVFLFGCQDTTLGHVFGRVEEEGVLPALAAVVAVTERTVPVVDDAVHIDARLRDHPAVGLEQLLERPIALRRRHDRLGLELGREQLGEPDLQSRMFGE